VVDIKRLYPLIEELRRKTGRRIALSPSSTLAVRAQLASEPYAKKVVVSYRVDSSTTGDVAHEILRAIQIGSTDWEKACPVPIDRFDKDSELVASWIQTLVNDVWVEDRIRRLAMRSKIHNEVLDTNLETLERDEMPYPGIEDSHHRLIYSMIQFASFLVTRKRISYGRRGELFERFYREREPKAMNVAITAAKIVRRHGCLSPKTAALATEELIQLAGMDDRLRLRT